MFRKLTDRLTSAITGNSSSNSTNDDGKIRTLQSMGFGATQARNALEATDGNVDRAAELLLTNSSGFGGTTSGNNNNNNVDDIAIRNAMEESLQTEEQRLYQQAHEASLGVSSAQQGTNNRSTANNKAARAAFDRAAAAQNQFGANKRTTNRKKQSNKTTSNNTLKSTTHYTTAASGTTSSLSMGSIGKHHPNVKLPKKLEEKSKEEQILRNVDRVKSHPSSVDTLYKALVALRNDPNNDKFRKIDKSSKGYQRSLANAPGAEALLLTMNFTNNRNTNFLLLDRSRVDPALLYLGISALENAKNSTEYKEAKQLLQFQKDIRDVMFSVNSSESEAVLRAGFMSNCPTEPPEGRGALMQVTLGDEVVRRRFDADDTLQDILNWLGGHGSMIPDKLVQTREWCLIDKNRTPGNTPINCDANKKRTLQYVGFWPSGKLEIRLSPMSWLERGNDEEVLITGSSRGLGAAPKDAL